VATESNRFTPSAALLKATLIAAARRVPYVAPSTGQMATKPVPSYEQGFGFPVLGDALFFPGDRGKLRVVDVPLTSGLAEGESTTLRLSAHAGTPLKIVLVWTDPPGVVHGESDSTPELVNDLDLRVIDPSGALHYGNDVLHPGQPDRLNNVEVVSVAQPLAGTYTITISANRIGLGPRQSYALVMTGDLDSDAQMRSRAVRH
jgi:serine protease AprX